MISIGGYHLPVPLHGKDNCDPETDGGDCGCSTGPDEAAEDSIETPGDGDAKTSEETATSDEEGDSYTKVSRGDWIRTSDLYVPNMVQ